MISPHNKAFLSLSLSFSLFFSLDSPLSAVVKYSFLFSFCTNISAHLISAHIISAHLVISTTSPMKTENPEDAQTGEDLDLPDSERPGIRPQDFGFIPPAMRPASPRAPPTRTETITVYLGRLHHRAYNVTRPNADYRSVPLPIMRPGSPDQQHVRRPSVNEFVRGPQRRDFVEECVAAREVDGHVSNINFPDADYRRLDREMMSRRSSPPRPPNLRRARRGDNHLSDSDISLLSLGSPLASLSTSDYLRASSSSSSSSSSASSSRGRRHGQKHHRSSSKRHSRHLDGIRAPVILSVDAPLGNDTSWSDPSSPRSQRSAASSLGGMFALDEELVCFPSCPLDL